MRPPILLFGFPLFFFPPLPLAPPRSSVSPPLSVYQDAVQLMANLAGNFEGIVQYNRDNTLFEVGTI